MIPPDVANNLRLLLPDTGRLTTDQPQNQPVAPAQRITDVLGSLQPGQRLLAEVQALLPNGSYRAVVAQREITLALPFSAKAGDSLELEVVESDGNVALAFVANRSATVDAGKIPDSVATRLSQTGRLIADLLGGIDQDGRKAAPAPLNGSQPLVARMPPQGADLAPLLKQALNQSGMFYEAHQARWVAGNFTTGQLLQEPQGKLSALTLPAAQALDAARAAATPPHGAVEGQPPSSVTLATPATPITSGDPNASPTPVEEAVPTATPAEADTLARDKPSAPPEAASKGEANAATLNTAKPGIPDSSAATAPRPEPAATAAPPGNPPASPAALPGELRPLVQQQLDALATQTFAWQGQVWPGQDLLWEIGSDPDGQHDADRPEGRHWQTRLKLDLPSLGPIDAMLRLRPGQGIEIAIVTGQAAGERHLEAQMGDLLAQFAAAGLALNQLNIRHVPPSE